MSTHCILKFRYTGISSTFFSAEKRATPGERENLLIKFQIIPFQSTKGVETECKEKKKFFNMFCLVYTFISTIAILSVCAFKSTTIGKG